MVLSMSIGGLENTQLRHARDVLFEHGSANDLVGELVASFPSQKKGAQENLTPHTQQTERGIQEIMGTLPLDASRMATDSCTTKIQKSIHSQMELVSALLLCCSACAKSHLFVIICLLLLIAQHEEMSHPKTVGTFTCVYIYMFNLGLSY